MGFTFEQVFGFGSYQDEQHLVINKAALSLSRNASAQSLLVALIIRIQQYCNGWITINGEMLSVGNSDFLEFNNSGLYPGCCILFTRNQLKERGDNIYFTHIYKLIFLDGTPTPP